MTFESKARCPKTCIRDVIIETLCAMWCAESACKAPNIQMTHVSPDINLGYFISFIGKLKLHTGACVRSMSLISHQRDKNQYDLCQKSWTFCSRIIRSACIYLNYSNAFKCLQNGCLRKISKYYCTFYDVSEVFWLCLVVYFKNDLKASKCGVLESN